MMTDVIDPNKLTKDQLYEALAEHGLTDIPTKRARKQEFVDLYLKHILSETETTDSKVNDSHKNPEDVDDDDEEIEFREQRPKSNLKRPNSKMPSVRKPDAPAEIQLMSDSELANQLRTRGVDVGPIIATTRKVYERKLAELLQGGPPAHVSSSEGEEEEMEDVTYEGEIYESEEPEIVPASKSSGYQSSIRHRAHIRESYSSQQAGAYSSHSYSGSSVAAAAQSSKPAKKKGMSLVAKLIILVIIAVLVYLVVVNMEGTRPKPPTLTQDSEKGKTET